MIPNATQKIMGLLCSTLFNLKIKAFITQYYLANNLWLFKIRISNSACILVFYYSQRPKSEVVKLSNRYLPFGLQAQKTSGSDLVQTVLYKKLFSCQNGLVFDSKPNYLAFRFRRSFYFGGSDFEQSLYYILPSIFDFNNF